MSRSPSLLPPSRNPEGRGRGMDARVRGHDDVGTLASRSCGSDKLNTSGQSDSETPEGLYT